MKSNKAVIKVIHPKPEEQSIAPLIKEVLARLGEDPRRDGLLQTPDRVDKALRFLTSGYRMDIHKIVNGALYEVKYDEMVVVKDIEFFSLCEHHLLPFFGKIHVAYLPRFENALEAGVSGRVAEAGEDPHRRNAAEHL